MRLPPTNFLSQAVGIRVYHSELTGFRASEPTRVPAWDISIAGLMHSVVSRETVGSNPSYPAIFLGKLTEWYGASLLNLGFPHGMAGSIPALSANARL